MSHKLRSPFTMQLITHLSWKRQVQSMQVSEYDQIQRTSRRCRSSKRDGRLTSRIPQTNLSCSLALWHRRYPPFKIASLAHRRTRYTGQNPSAGSRKYYSMVYLTVRNQIAFHSAVVERKTTELSCVYGLRAYSIWNRCIRTSRIPPRIFR